MKVNMIVYGCDFDVAIVHAEDRHGRIFRGEANETICNRARKCMYSGSDDFEFIEREEDKITLWENIKTIFHVILVMGGAATVVIALIIFFYFLADFALRGLGIN